MNIVEKFLTGGVLAMAAGSALAVPIGSTNATRPAGGIVIGNSSDGAGLCQPAYANCELQSILNVLSGNTLNAATDQNNTAMFAIGPGPQEVTVPFLRIEVTANAASQVFGIFSDADGLSETAGDRSYAPIFNGAATNGAVSTVLFDFPSSSVTINGSNVYGGIKPGNFGFYLLSCPTCNYLYSSDAMNPQGGTQFIAYNYMPANRWILGFEDVFRLAYGSRCNKQGTSDCDHNDIIVTIESIVRAPEPGTLALLGLGLLGLGATARRRRR
jgi:hypothetical protein